LAAPLVAWLFGSWLLLGTTVFYILAVWLMEEDFLLGGEVRRLVAAEVKAVVRPALTGLPSTFVLVVAVVPQQTGRQSFDRP